MKRQVDLKTFLGGASQGQKRRRRVGGLVECPSCSSKLFLADINDHLDSDCSRGLPTPEELAEALEGQAGKAAASPAPKLPTCVKTPIQGLFMVYDFVDEEEEGQIMRLLDAEPWKLEHFNGPKFHKGFGADIDYKNRTVRISNSSREEIPPGLTFVFDKMRREVPVLNDFFPNQIGANDYRRKQGHLIRPHVDDRTLSGPFITNLSLLADCYMTFTQVDPGRKPLLLRPTPASASPTSSGKAGGGAEEAPAEVGPQAEGERGQSGQRELFRVLSDGSVQVLLARRSLQIMTGESRYNWKHAIENEYLLEDRRISVTMRQLSLGLK